MKLNMYECRRSMQRAAAAVATEARRALAVQLRLLNFQRTHARFTVPL
jgi:hypothetical protein